MDMQNSILITLCWELHEQDIPKSHIAQQLNKNQQHTGLFIFQVVPFSAAVYLKLGPFYYAEYMQVH